MSDLLDFVVDTFPANNDVGVPLLSNVVITLSGLDFDEESLKEGLFVTGPDTDQYVGPGLELQAFPDGVSQGELDNFLESPGWTGFVQGTITVSGISGNTVVTFDPTHPLAPNLAYVVHLAAVLNADQEEIEGFVSFSFETGSGSIEVVPSTVSTSILSSGIPEATAPAQAEAFAVVATSPADRAIQQPKDLDEIIVTFNKDIDPSTVDAADIIVRTTPVTDHPNASKQSIGDLAKVIEVAGKQLKIKI